MYPQNVSELLPDVIVGDDLLVARHYRVRILRRIARRRDAAEANVMLGSTRSGAWAGSCAAPGSSRCCARMSRLARAARTSWATCPSASSATAASRGCCSWLQLVRVDHDMLNAERQAFEAPQGTGQITRRHVRAR